MQAQAFIDQFEYRRGAVFIDGWAKLKPGQSGDCDDFAFTVALILSGGFIRLLLDLLLFRAGFWLVKSPSNRWWPRHVVLWHHRGGWIDSTFRDFRDTPAPHKRRFPILSVWGVAWVLLRAFMGLLFGGK